ncbi:glucose 1-dehydrogenase [Penicillium malachiteum]|nr:glucose 1-dehydrogenase [Penicillium malachiteum]
MGKRVLVGYGIDVDAVSGWINTEDGHIPDLTDISRDRMEKIHEAGHEINKCDVLAKSVEAVVAFTGKHSKGWTASSWRTSSRSIRLLEEYGLEYDHSFMRHDSQLYYVPYGSEGLVATDLSKPAEQWMKPMAKLEAGKIVEVPANWHLDDWPPFQLTEGPSHGYVDPVVIERLWKSQFDFLYREYDTFVFPISIHPQNSGKPQVIMLHERLIEYINSHEGVEWCTFAQMVEEFKSGRIEGVDVVGGKNAMIWIMIL